nr:putative ORF1 [Marmot picobirnavirus]
MTDLQIKYWDLQENRRHNTVTEGETNRHNVATEDLGIKTLDESRRHNIVTEGETRRHNVAGETLGVHTLQESIRHNRVTEAETMRHNVAGENENRRHNIASETNERNKIQNLAALQAQQIEESKARTKTESVRQSQLKQDIDYTKSRTQGQNIDNSLRQHKANIADKQYSDATYTVQAIGQNIGDFFSNVSGLANLIPSP